MSHPPRKRYRPDDALEIAPSQQNICGVVQGVMLPKDRDVLWFLVNKPLRTAQTTQVENRIKAVLFVIDNQRRLSIYESWATAYLAITTECNPVARRLSQLSNKEIDQIDLLMRIYPQCVTFLLGLLPQMGRNEYVWMEVDPDTRKRFRTSPESTIYQAFRTKELSEPQIIRHIFSFLY